MEITEYLNEMGNMRNLNKSKLAVNTEMLRSNSEYIRAKRRGNFILRQELKDYTLECTSKVSIFINILLFLIFMVFGVPIVLSSENIMYIKVRYDRCTTKDIIEPGGRPVKKCEVTFKLNQTYPAPIHVYYEISGFYLNHMKMVNSRNWAQIRGESVSTSNLLRDCKGMVYNKDLFGNQSKSYTNETLDPDGILSPCGKIAASMFNDNFTLYSVEKKNLTKVFINETEISYESDRKISFKQSPEANKTQWIDVTNEHFIVWMQSETFTTFQKIWGRIDKDLPAGEYMIHVENVWQTELTDTTKSFVISSSQGLGSASFFGWSLLKAAFICSCAVVILLITKVTQKNTFDESDLSWE